jgi:hypothetical protein
MLNWQSKSKRVVEYLGAITKAFLGRPRVKSTKFPSQDWCLSAEHRFPIYLVDEAVITLSSTKLSSENLDGTLLAIESQILEWDFSHEIDKNIWVSSHLLSGQ